MSLFVLFLIFAKIAVLTFGGGYAMVPLFEHEIVVRHAFMSAADFANLIGLAQVTPGPIGFNSATYVGMAQGGFLGSVVASLGVMVPSIIISLVIAIFLRKAADAKWMKLLMKGVRPCVVGIIGAAVIFALIVFIRWKWSKLNPIWSLAVSAFFGWALFLI